MSETSEDVAPQSRQRNRRLYGEGHKLAPPPHTIQTSIRFCDFAEQCLL